MKAASRSLILLLGLTLGLAGLLGVEALRATRSHRVTAERALRDYASVAAWELLTATDEQLQRVAGAALGPATGSPAASPYDSVPAAAALSPAADSLLPCATGSRFTFAIDLRSGAVTTAGTSPAAGLRAWLADSIAREARATTVALGRYVTAWTPRGSAPEAVAVYGVRPCGQRRGARRAARRVRPVSCPAAMAGLVAGSRPGIHCSPLSGGGLPRFPGSRSSVRRGGELLHRGRPPAGRLRGGAQRRRDSSWCAPGCRRKSPDD